MAQAAEEAEEILQEERVHQEKVMKAAEVMVMELAEAAAQEIEVGMVIHIFREMAVMDYRVLFELV